jgi:hypothetical protein
MNFSTVSQIGLALASACLASGCMAMAAAPELENLGSFGGSTGGAYSGFAGTESNVAVNKSWIDINKVTARSMRFKMAASEREQREEKLRRNVALGILKDIRDFEGGNPQLADLIAFVEAGGDPQSALAYALDSQARQRKDAELRQTTVGLLQGMAQRQRANPDLPMLIAWVRAGGDPQYALNYALSHRAPPPAPAARPKPPTPPAPAQGLSSR